jgi:phosphotransferase system  glucose/maltose/N-acetylglucosamine-specific IIC component
VHTCVHGHKNFVPFAVLVSLAFLVIRFFVIIFCYRKEMQKVESRVDSKRSLHGFNVHTCVHGHKNFVLFAVHVSLAFLVIRFFCYYILLQKRNAEGGKQGASLKKSKKDKLVGATGKNVRNQN